MKIALINDNSQGAKSSIIFNVLDKVAKKYNHTSENYGTLSAEDNSQLTYVQCGLMTAILLNTHCVDFVITGCGTGEGAMLASNSFPNVLCGHIVDPSDAYMFMQINNGNAVSLPYAKGFGWGAELNLEYIFEQLFAYSAGNGYPAERAEPEKRNKLILDDLKKITHSNMIDILKNIDQNFLKQTVSSSHFKQLFLANCDNSETSNYIKSIL